jgi:hypothetical protein
LDPNHESPVRKRFLSAAVIANYPALLNPLIPHGDEIWGAEARVVVGFMVGKVASTARANALPRYLKV